MINEQVYSATAAGTFTIGNDLTVNRLGYDYGSILGCSRPLSLNVV
jgi:hypothetical protein